MSKIKGSISIDIIDKKTVHLEIEMLRNLIAIAINKKLDGLYIYDEKPYLETDNGDYNVEVTLHGLDDYINEDDINWEREIYETIRDLARESLNPTE